MKDQEKITNAFSSLLKTVHHLRAPGGCPWDREQTHQSLRPYLIEEAFEVLDVLDEIKSPESLKDAVIHGSFKEELGDLLLQILLHSEITAEEEVFNMGDVCDSLNEKLIRRHPHVFGKTKAETADDAYASWEKIKAEEKKAKGISGKKAGVLGGLPKNLPALQKAERTIAKVSKVGFQWPDMEGPVGKVDEELAELKTELKKYETNPSDENRSQLESEMGDLLFTICNLAYLTGVKPEDALRGQLSRFENRFRHVETRLDELGKTPNQSTLEEMDKFWDEAKAKEKTKEKAKEK